MNKDERKAARIGEALRKLSGGKPWIYACEGDICTNRMSPLDAINWLMVAIGGVMGSFPSGHRREIAEAVGAKLLEIAEIKGDVPIHSDTEENTAKMREWFDQFEVRH